MQSESDREADDKHSLRSSGSSSRRKRVNPYDRGVPKPERKRKKVDMEDEGEFLPYFDPATFVDVKEGTFKAPTAMRNYLNKHMK